MEHNWLTYYGSNIDRLFETDETDIQSALTLTSVATMFYRPNSFGHDMRHLIKELQQVSAQFLSVFKLFIELL